MAKIGRYGSHMISPSELLNTGLRRASALRALQSAPPQGVAFRKSGEHPKIQGVKTAFSATNYYKWDFSQMILGYFRFSMVFNSSKTGFLNFNSSKAHSILLMGHSTGYSWFCGWMSCWFLGTRSRNCDEGMQRWGRYGKMIIGEGGIVSEKCNSSSFPSFPFLSNLKRILHSSSPILQI